MPSHATSSRAGVEATPEQLVELDEAIAEADRGEGIPWERFGLSCSATAELFTAVAAAQMVDQAFSFLIARL